LGPISARTTRLRVATRNGSFFYDAATANEIVAQTQKALEAPAVTDFAAKRIRND